MPRNPIAVRCLLAALFGLLISAALSQGPGTAQRFREMSASAEKAGLAEPFKGITAAGAVEPGLFKIRSTGVSTEPVRKAAEAFLAGLTPEQRAKTTYSRWTIPNGANG